MGADRSQWQYPRNEADKVVGWRPDGKGLENKDWLDPANALKTSDIGSGSDLSQDPDKLAKRGDVGDAIDAAVTPVVADRAALKAVDTTAHTSLYLREEGRAGQFVWDASDLSGKVSVDTEEGIYIAPASDPTGASGAWVRQWDGPADIKWWGPAGDGVTNDRPAFQAAYNVLPDRHELRLTPALVSYTLSTAVTLSGDKRLYYRSDPGVNWTTELDARKAIGNETPSTAIPNFQRFEHFTDFSDGHGGSLLISALKADIDASISSQWDAVRIHSKSLDDGSSAPIGAGHVTLGLFNYGNDVKATQAQWGVNSYVYLPVGGRGTMRGVEANLDNPGDIAPSAPSNPENKIGFFATTKRGHATAAFFAGKGGGNGWYHGYYVNQAALVDHANSRAFCYDGFFEIRRDGTVEMGGTFAEGADGKRFNPSTGYSLQSSRSATTNASHQSFYNPNGQVGSITTNGSATAFNTSSDERLKENPRAFDAGAIIDAIDVWQFDWKVGGSGYGVLAQQCYEVFPDAISPGDSDLTQEGAQPWAADYSKFVPLLLAEVKALRARVAVLEGA